MCGAWRHFWETVLGERWWRGAVPTGLASFFLSCSGISWRVFASRPPYGFAHGRLSRWWLGKLSRLEFDDFHLSFED
jgi:hypothetical protein